MEEDKKEYEILKELNEKFIYFNVDNKKKVKENDNGEER